MRGVMGNTILYEGCQMGRSPGMKYHDCQPRQGSGLFELVFDGPELLVGLPFQGFLWGVMPDRRVLCSNDRGEPDWFKCP